MIKIEFFDNGLKINGHANADNFGNDIYCAGVSSIALGAINWFDQNEIIYKINDGSLELKIIKITNENLYLLKLLKIQLQALMSDEYKKYIQIIEYRNKGF